jgi:spermidine/putrescine transport system ATP-binding protein
VTNNDVQQGGFAAAGADLELVGITKRFPGFTAIEDLDLFIPAGSFFALLGRRAVVRRRLCD